MSEDIAKRTTLADLERGFYSHTDHSRLADKGMRRYHPYSFDFDSTAMLLEEPGEHWEEQVRELHLKNREQVIAGLKERYGVLRHDQVIQNLRDLGPKPFSLIAYHNRFYHEAREAFIIGSYYPALVSACALGERILNHLILDLRRTSNHLLIIGTCTARTHLTIGDLPALSFLTGASWLKVLAINFWSWESFGTGPSTSIRKHIGCFERTRLPRLSWWAASLQSSLDSLDISHGSSKVLPVLSSSKNPMRLTPLFESI